jgi:hypothetical protein
VNNFITVGIVIKCLRAFTVQKKILLDGIGTSMGTVTLNIFFNLSICKTILNFTIYLV